MVIQIGVFDNANCINLWLSFKNKTDVIQMMSVFCEYNWLLHLQTLTLNMFFFNLSYLANFCFL